MYVFVEGQVFAILCVMCKVSRYKHSSSLRIYIPLREVISVSVIKKGLQLIKHTEE